MPHLRRSDYAMTDATARHINCRKHNEEVRLVWHTYNSNEPVRVPLRFGINPRYTMFDHPANPRGITFEQYAGDPQTMLERQLEHEYWVRCNVPQDSATGVPEDGWPVYVDFQNYYEAVWYGADVKFRDGQVPDSVPPLADDNTKWRLIEAGTPDPFTHGGAELMWRIYHHFVQKQKEGWTFRGKPIARVEPPASGTDGVLTVACNLRGTEAFMTDLVTDPDYAHALLEYILDTSVKRILAYREATGQEMKPDRGGLADDSIQLISTAMYEEHILPCHRRYLSELFGEGPHGMHLCGDATRHFRLIRDELNVWSFDTGFPVDFAWLREELGPDVEIQGGPSVPFLQSATPQQVFEECRRILNSGIMKGGRFILREGNNLAPGIGLDKLWAMWDAVHEHGLYWIEDNAD